MPGLPDPPLIVTDTITEIHQRSRGADMTLRTLTRVPDLRSNCQMRCVGGAPAGLCGVNELVGHAIPTARGPGPLVALVRSRTVANVDSVGLACL